MPGGAPTKYRPEFCDKVIELGKAGKSIVQIASALDVHKDTLYEWEKVHPKFSDSLSRARQESQVWWEDQGQIGLSTPGYNSSLWSKQVSCRFPNDYRETTRQENQQLDKEGKPTDPSGHIIKVVNATRD